MTREQHAVYVIKESIINKDVLEIGCGSAKFSLRAAESAKSVTCIDLTDEKLHEDIQNCPNVKFEKMDAADMKFKDSSFDTIVFYNSVYHMDTVLHEVINECKRVLRDNGYIYIISSFKLDKSVIENKLLSILDDLNIRYVEAKDKFFYYIRMR